MSALRFSGFVFAMGVCGVGALLAQHEYTPADIQEGQRLFRDNCVLCHGPEGDQIPGIDLSHGKFRQTYSEDALVRIIEDGKPGTPMPPSNLRDSQAAVVLAYLRSIGSSGPGHLRRQGRMQAMPSSGRQRIARGAGFERHRRPAPHC
jgi:mono/diheme cytochrome c family protein